MKMKLFRMIAKVTVCVLSLGLIAGCSGQAPEANDNQTPFEGKNPIATITLKDGRKIEVELYPDKAPNTVNNFIYLANTRHFYDGLIFHRVIENFMIQGGCPQGTGTGNPGYQIKGEFSNNGYTRNDLSHKEGVISMARGGYSMDSAGSQFFICAANPTYLDGDYAAFGMTISGYDVVLDIAKADTNYNDKPYEDIVMETVRVETFGQEFPVPVTNPQV